ncbi:MAG: DUF3619 family protein [Candidatus Protistobacter heckmanni]|nr:DUF3619 family protein [Candidatus Protistobacter heckmanni]
MRIHLALNEASEQLPSGIADALAAGRAKALTRKKPEAERTLEPAFAGSPGLSAGGGSSPASGDKGLGDLIYRLIGKLGLVGTLAALALILAVIAQWQRQTRVDELAELDASVLIDELPPAAYTDHGFQAFLASCPSASESAESTQ